MTQTKIAVIGVGNMGSAIVDGIILKEFLNVENITLARRNLSALSKYDNTGIQITADNVLAIKKADYIVLAVKPFQVKEVLDGIAPHVNYSKQAFISVVTGVWMDEYLEVLASDAVIFRAMPNTAAAIGESMTCITQINASKTQIDFVQELFATIGKTVFIEEKLMDAATVLGACGTAFALRYIRANIQGGIQIGFDAATATTIAAQTVKGAAALLLENNSHPEQEIDKVTTPKGCTIAGLNEMEHQGFSSSLIRGVVASYDKIIKDL